MARFEDYADEFIAHEGGAQYTNNPADSGGPTRFGVTLKTLSAWRGKPCTADDIQKLGRDEACTIFRVRYWEECRCSELTDARLAAKVCDFAITAGPAEAILALQRALNQGGAHLDPDGKIGVQTISAANAADPVLVRRHLAQQQACHYGWCIGVAKKNEAFRKDWMWRADWLAA